MTTADELEIARTKLKALEAYRKWKTAELQPRFERWFEDGCDAEEIDKRLNDLSVEVEDEVIRTLRLVTIFALKRGAYDGEDGETER